MSAFSFDPSAPENNQQGEKRDFDLLQPADYPLEVIKEEMKPTKDGNGKRLLVTFRVTEGDSAGRRLFIGYNVVNESKQAEQISRAQLSKLCVAAGIGALTDSSDLLGAEVIGKVTVKPAKGNFPASNDIAAYKPRGGTKPAPTAATSAPWGA